MAPPVAPKEPKVSPGSHQARDESVGHFEWVSDAAVAPLPESSLIAARFKSGGRGRAWGAVSDADWNDWRWQQRNRVTRMEQLETVVTVTDEERRAFQESDAMFHMGITPYYGALMDPEDPHCPIRLQSVPKMGELTFTPADLED